MSDPLAISALALTALTAGTGWLLIVAALAKLRDSVRWQADLAAYQLLPDALVRLVATLLPPCELALGAGLVSGLALVPCGEIAAGLLLLFAGAMAINLLRGRTELSCGCGAAPRPINWAIVTGNLGIAAICITHAVTADKETASLRLLAASTGTILFLLLIAIARLRNLTTTHAAPLGR